MDVSLANLKKTTQELSKFENRISGSEMEHEAAEYLAAKLAEVGFINIVQHKFPVISWYPEESSLEIVTPTKRSIDCVILPYTTDVEERVKLIDMNQGDDKGTNHYPVYGLIDWGPKLYGTPTDAYNLALEMGLQGLIISSPDDGDLFKVLVVDRCGDLQIPVFNVTKEEGAMLRSLLETSEVIINARAIAKKSHSDSRNLEVLIQGPADDYDIIIGAHYDAWFSGAADNAVSVAIVLELARLLKNHVNGGGELKRTVRFLLYGAEESGSEGFYYLTNGSRVFVESQESLDRIGLVVNLDCVGFHAPNYVVTTHEMSEYSKSIISKQNQEDRFVQWAPPGHLSDHWFFTKGGVPTIYLIPWPSELYHTQKDTPEAIDFNSVQAYAEFALNAIIDFSNSEILPYNLFNQLEAIRARISEFNMIDIPSISLQSILDVLNEILKHERKTRKFAEEAATSGDSEKITKLNNFMRKACSSINKTIDLLLPVEGVYPAKHFGFLDYCSELDLLENAIKALESLPIMSISPKTRDRFRNFQDNPLQWVEGERAIDDLKTEREKLLQLIQRETADATNIMTIILEDMKTLILQ
ncbi:MAG: M28 family peptidase [Candidatus Thorarchaeota archaeon]